MKRADRLKKIEADYLMLGNLAEACFMNGLSVEAYHKQKNAIANFKSTAVKNNFDRALVRKIIDKLGKRYGLGVCNTFKELERKIQVRRGVKFSFQDWSKGGIPQIYYGELTKMGISLSAIKKANGIKQERKKRNVCKDQ